MLTPKPFEFNPENLASIASYRSKWEKIACLTEPLDHEQVSAAINQAYDFIGLNNPNIIFFREPYDALDYVYREVTAYWGKLDQSGLGNAIASKLVTKLLGNLRTPESEDIVKRLELNLGGGKAKSQAMEVANRFEPSLIVPIVFAHGTSLLNTSLETDPEPPGITKSVIKSFLDLFSTTAFIQTAYFAPVQLQLFKKFIDLIAKEQSAKVRESWQEMGTDLLAGHINRQQTGEYQLPAIEASLPISNIVIPSVLADIAYYIDYAHEVLEFERNYLKWSIFSDLITNCGWFFPYEKTVLVCDR